jgi:hypothetical protein
MTRIFLGHLLRSAAVLSSSNLALIDFTEGGRKALEIPSEGNHGQ